MYFVNSISYKLFLYIYFFTFILFTYICGLYLQGLEYLIENDLLKNTHEDISEFLYKGEGLSKRAIGDYLGER